MTASRQSLDFGRRVRPSGGPKVRVMAGILAVVTLATWAVHRRSDRPVEPVVAADEVVIEVRGAVSVPGFHPVAASATVSDAVLLAGGVLDLPDLRPLEPGQAITVEGGAAHLGLMEDTLVVGIPVDLNRAGAPAFEALPGIGRARADAIVSDRSERGPFRSVEELERVRGVGPATVEALRPFVVVRR